MRQAQVRTGPQIDKLHHAWRPTDNIRESLALSFPGLQFPYLETDHTHGVNSAVHAYCPHHDLFTRIGLAGALYGNTQFGCSECAAEHGHTMRKAAGFSFKNYIGRRGVQSGIFRAVKAEFPDAVWEHRMDNGKEIDIFIPSLNGGVEYNGNYYHSTAVGKDDKYHAEKTVLGQNEGKFILHVFSDEAVAPYTNIVNCLKSAVTKIDTNTKKIKYVRVPKDEARLFHQTYNFRLMGDFESFCDLSVGMSINKKLVAVMSGDSQLGFVLYSSFSSSTLNTLNLVAKFAHESNKANVQVVCDLRNPIESGPISNDFGKFFNDKIIDHFKYIWPRKIPLNKNFEIDVGNADPSAFLYDCGCNVFST
jgi:hypothetical protein